MGDNISFVIMFIIAAFITAVARLKFIIDNPATVVRYENGTIHWKYNLFVSAVELMIGGVVGVAVGIVCEYYHLLSDNMLLLAVCMSGLVGGKLFESVQRRLIKKN